MQTQSSCYGSSPHERGTGLSQRHAPADDRFIPARAGNSAARRHASEKRAVHPRTSGEQPDVAPFPDTIDGSSPHERGTAPATATTVSGRRFIPARAGNRHASRIIHSGLFGSSPHERGTVKGMTNAGRAIRFIPARAGNRNTHTGTHGRGAVHPRTSGEQIAQAVMGHTTVGSSPHERGTDLARAID